MTPAYTAVVLAADRGAQDPVAAAAGAACKALTPVGGRPMLQRVLETLRQCAAIDALVLVGPAPAALPLPRELARLCEALGVVRLSPERSPAASVLRALAAVPQDKPVLVATADHALLRPDMVAEFVDGARAPELAVALARYPLVRAAYPNSRRTRLRLGADGGYCGCNLFAFNTSNARRLVATWQKVEAQRKRPWRLVVDLLGWQAIGRYLVGKLSLDGALARISERSGVHVGAVLLSAPEAAIDVDTLADLRLVESILAREAAAG